MLPQKHMLEMLEHAGPNDKWGLYIRAPEIYFEILEAARDKLVPLSEVADIRRGITTGINEFFYLKEVPDKKVGKALLYVRNDRGWEGEIESTYLKKAIVSPKEAQTISISRDQLENYMFVCNESKPDLRKKGHLGALSYIEWGEKQKTTETKNTKGGIPWLDVSSVKSRRFWYGLGTWVPGNILLQMINNNRFVAFYNKDNVCVDHNLFEITCSPERLRSLLALTNSTLFALFREVHSRVNLGDGATKTEGIDWQNMPIPDVSSIPSLNKLPDPTSWDRKVKSVGEELKMKDRQHLDAAVIKAIGLDPNYYLPRIYDGLKQLVTERLQLPKMRGKVKKQKVNHSLHELKSTLAQELLPNGLRKIDTFIHNRALFEEVPTTGKPLLLGDLLFDKQEVLDEEGALVVAVQGSYTGRFVVYQYTPGNYFVLVPKPDYPNAQIQARRTLKDYEIYIKKTREQIYARAFEMTVDASVADRIADELLAENGYYPIRHYPKKPRRKP